MSPVELTDLGHTVGGSMPLRSLLVRFSTTGPWPGVIAIHEIFGLNEVVQRHAERLAAAGYLTVAIDLYSNGGARRCLVSTMRALAKGEGRPFRDINAAREWLSHSHECTGKVGVIGFCMGGGFALLTAKTGFDVASANYGQLPKDLDVLEDACPVVASYGGRDRTLKNAANTLDAVLTKFAIVHDVREYPHAGHAFLNDAEVGPRVLRPLLRLAGVGPNPVAASHAWQSIEQFFTEHLN